VKTTIKARAMRDAKFVVIWEFLIRKSARRKFEKAYGPDGLWATLFRAGAGYIRTELIRDRETPDRYLTLDFWAARSDYERFKKQKRAEYEKVDQRCESLTRDEREIGQFTAIRGKR